MKKFIYSILCIAFFSAVAISVSSCGDDAVEDINKEENDEGNNEGTNNSFKIIGKYEVGGWDDVVYIEFKTNASAIVYDEFGESEELLYRYNEETKIMTILEPDGKIGFYIKLDFYSNDRIVGTEEGDTEGGLTVIFKRLANITFAPIIGTWRIYDNNHDADFQQMSIGCKGTLIWRQYNDVENEISYDNTYTYEDNILTWYLSNGYLEAKWYVLEITDTKMLTTWIKSSDGDGEIEEWTKIPHRDQQ